MSNGNALPVLMPVTAAVLALFVYLFGRFAKRGYMETPYRFCILFFGQIVIEMIGVCALIILNPQNLSRLIALFLLFNFPITALLIIISAKTVKHSPLIHKIMKVSAGFLIILFIALMAVALWIMG